MEYMCGDTRTIPIDYVMYNVIYNIYKCVNMHIHNNNIIHTARKMYLQVPAIIMGRVTFRETR